MDKKEILAKYRAEEDDEGRKHLNYIGDDKGMVALSALAFVLMMYKSYRNLPIGDILSLLFIFTAVGMFYRYRHDKQIWSLVFLIGSTIGCIFSLVLFVAATL